MKNIVLNFQAIFDWVNTFLAVGIFRNKNDVEIIIK